MPASFSGDLRTLTADNIAHYRKRFGELERLERTYGIYRRFQFSGVPGPTETDWHWWGKLNDKGSGAVVVLRGKGGAARRAVNLPWVRPELSYHVSGVFSGKSYGVFSGRTLQDAGLSVELPVYGQEVLELAAADK